MQGTGHLKEKRFGQARRALKLAVAYFPQYSAAHANLGKAWIGDASGNEGIGGEDPNELAKWHFRRAIR